MNKMFDSLKKICESIILLQVVFLFCFILFNFDSLNAVSIGISLGENNYVITIDLYATSIISVIVFVVIATAVSINVAASGLNEIGSRSVIKFIALFTVFAFFLLSEGWIFQYLKEFGTILFIFFRLADILYFVVQLEE